MSETAARRDERMIFRASRSERKTLEAAAEARGETLSDLMRRAALREARSRILRDHVHQSPTGAEEE